jgi:beta-glucosidase
MRIKHKYVILFFLVTTINISAQDKNMSRFIDSLLNSMTLEEKLGQMNLISPSSRTGPFANINSESKLKSGMAGNMFGFDGTVSFIHEKRSLSDSSRLKIPLLNGLDIIHGYKTIFPIPLGLSCSWDTTLIEKTARVAAVEATSVGYNWTFSPMVDITRDPRWGRVMEGSGEDPYLGSLIAKAMVRGYQGKNLQDGTSLLSCVKHIGLYGASEAGRDYNGVDMSLQSMYQFYLPPYKAAIDAGAISFMSSFNDINGIPATANKWLLTDLLRNQWNYKGFVVSDFNGVHELITHGVASNLSQASLISIDAGLDMDMMSEGFVSQLKTAVKEAKINEEQINTACRRILEAKYKLGLFGQRSREHDSKKVENSILTASHLQIAKEATLKSAVLLKNDNHVLPLKKGTRIALVGPFADNKKEMFSMWSFTGNESKVITIFEGLKRQNSTVSYFQGSQVSNDSMFNARNKTVYSAIIQKKLIKNAVREAIKSDVVVAVVGESYAMSGEAKSRADLSIPACQSELLYALRKTGKPVVLILLNGRPLTLEKELKYADAILEIWRPGTMAGDAVADILFGEYNPSGKLTMTFPRSVGQIPNYYSHKSTGRPYIPGGKESYVSNYIDAQNSPLFPFGFGLSYTKFAYSPITLSDTLVNGSQHRLYASIHISNNGSYKGEETVQLYLNDVTASITRPVKELKSFQKVILEPGETQKLVFEITPEMLKFYNNDLVFDWESGYFNLYIGSNSAETEVAKFRWVK